MHRSGKLSVACREYADFRVSSDGEVQGVGLLIAADPNSGRLVVLAPISGGPADRAGVQPGDEVGPGKQGVDDLGMCATSASSLWITVLTCIS